MNVWNNEVHIYKYFLSLYGILFYFYSLVYNIFKLYFYWRIITLQCCVLSTIQQHESAVSVHLFPPLEPPSHLPSIPPLSVITEHGGELPVLYSHFTLASCLTHGNVYMCQCYPQLIPPSPSPLGPQVCSLCLSLYFCSANRFLSTIFLDSIYML